jgi:hypothetical protein
MALCDTIEDSAQVSQSTGCSEITKTFDPHPKTGISCLRKLADITYSRGTSSAQVKVSLQKREKERNCTN